MPNVVPPFQAQTSPQSQTGLLVDGSIATGNPIVVRPSFPTYVAKIAFPAGSYVIATGLTLTLHAIFMKPGSTSGITIFDDNVAPGIAGHEIYFASGNMSSDVDLLFDVQLLRGISITTTGAVNFDSFTLVLGSGL